MRLKRITLLKGLKSLHIIKLENPHDLLGKELISLDGNKNVRYTRVVKVEMLDSGKYIIYFSSEIYDEMAVMVEDRIRALEASGLLRLFLLDKEGEF